MGATGDGAIVVWRRGFLPGRHCRSRPGYPPLVGGEQKPMKYETIPLPQGTEMFWVDCHTNVNFSPPCFLAVVTKQGGLMVRDVNWWPEPLEGNWIPIWDPRNTYEDLS